jgi:hypothetical protein
MARPLLRDPASAAKTDWNNLLILSSSLKLLLDPGGVSPHGMDCGDIGDVITAGPPSARLVRRIRRMPHRPVCGARPKRLDVSRATPHLSRFSTARPDRFYGLNRFGNAHAFDFGSVHTCNPSVVTGVLPFPSIYAACFTGSVLPRLLTARISMPTIFPLAS